MMVLRRLVEPESQAKAHPPSQLVIAIDADHQLEILVLVEPIWNLSKQAVASYYLRPLVFEVLGGATAAIGPQRSQFAGPLGGRPGDGQERRDGAQGRSKCGLHLRSSRASSL